MEQDTGNNNKENNSEHSTEEKRESKQERRARLRAEKEEKRQRAYMKKQKKKIISYTLVILVVGLVGYGLYLLSQTGAPEGEDLSVGYDIQGRQHIQEGAEHPQYNSNPPSSGWHYASPTRGGFYEEPVADERVVHNLEHGDIWIAYHPEVSDEVKAALRDLAGRHVVVSPRAENEGDISLVAWGRVDTFDVENGALDEQRIRDFIRRYDNKGPEKVRGI